MLIEAHRENQQLWSTWYRRATTADEKSSLYRYREGFDAAIFLLVERFQIDLHNATIARHINGNKRGQVITVEKLDLIPEKSGIRCPHCSNLLFRKGNRLWQCPACGVNFLADDERE